MFSIFKKVETDIELQELASHGTGKFPIRYYLDDSRDFFDQVVNRHWHREVEFALVREGEVSYWIGEENITLNRGEGVFINSRVIHGYTAEQPSVVPNIVFSPEFIAGGNPVVYEKYIEPILHAPITCLPIRKENPAQSELLRLLEYVFELFETDRETKELDLQLASTGIWRELFLHRHECRIALPSSNSLSNQNRLRVMLEYIYENYARKISLADIAAAAKVSKSEALRCFKEGTATSPVDYLIQYRLNRAKQLLIETDRTVTEISSEVGLDNVGYFARLFKRMFNRTPNQLRKEYRKR